VGSVHELFYVDTDDLAELAKMSEFYRRAYDLDRDSAETNLGLGWDYFYQGDNDTAYAHFLRAFELDPNKFEVNYHIGGFLRSVGLLEKAIKYYNQALVLNPGESVSPALRTLPDGSALELRLICLIEMGRFQDALEELEAIRDQVPDDINIRSKLVNLYMRMDKREEAEGELAHIRELNETDVRIPFYQAMVFAELGEHEKALDPIRKGYPPEALHLVAQIYCGLGMKSEAIQVIKEGIEVGLTKVQTYMFPYQYLVNNPQYNLLRTESEFQEIVRSQKKIYDSMVENYRDL
jgi:tetratricopeptide (TPR) repeat protein